MASVFGFLETPYRKVKNGKVSKSVDYLSADQEDEFIIAQANAPISDDGKFVLDRVKCRKRGEFPVVAPGVVHYMDVAPSQLVSAGASFTPSPTIATCFPSSCNFITILSLSSGSTSAKT